jgi:hypothetical protein
VDGIRTAQRWLKSEHGGAGWYVFLKKTVSYRTLAGGQTMHRNVVLQVEALDEDRFTAPVAGLVDRRNPPRRVLTLAAVTSNPKGDELPVTIRDISQTGFLIETNGMALSKGELININLPNKGLVSARVVWANERLFGCEFDEEISSGAISAALLRAQPRQVEAPALFEASEAPVPRRTAVSFEPELNFAVAAQLTIVFWAVVGSGAYFIFA